MAVNPEQGTSNMQEAASQIEGILGGEGVEELQDAVETDEVEETTDESEEETDEVEAEDEADETEAESEEEAEETDEEISTLEELAEATGRTAEELLEAMTTTVKVDGETSEVTLSELKAGYQKDRDYRQKTEALKREREEWEQQRANYQQSVEQQHQIAAYILNNQEQSLMQVMNSDEMAQLKQQNREEWLTKRYEFQDRLQQIQHTKQEAASQLDAFRQQQQYEQQQRLQETLAQEREALNRELPNLNTEALTQYLTQTGFLPEEVGQVYDHRLVKLAEKARLYDEQASKAEATTKKVKKAPKAPRPSKGQSPAKVKRSELAKVRGRLKKSGHIRDAAQYLLESGQV